MPDFLVGNSDWVILITYIVGQSIQLYKDWRNHKWAKEKDKEAANTAQELKTNQEQIKTTLEETKTINIDAVNHRKELDERIAELTKQFLEVKKDGGATEIAIIATNSKKTANNTSEIAANTRKRKRKRARVSRKTTPSNQR